MPDRCDVCERGGIARGFPIVIDTRTPALHRVVRACPECFFKVLKYMDSLNPEGLVVASELYTQPVRGEYGIQ